MQLLYIFPQLSYPNNILPREQKYSIFANQPLHHHCEI